MDESKYLSLVKTIKVVGIALGVALLLLGVAQYVFYDNPLGFGEDAMLGLFLICFSYVFSSSLLRKEKMKEEVEEEEEHDQGL